MGELDIIRRIIGDIAKLVSPELALRSALRLRRSFATLRNGLHYAPALETGCVSWRRARSASSL
jgi:hypothetical protein